ncbi:hypothetical protein [Paludisphaera soli]|uniref:hypothetical protein n=1 Tax=Paludisphaera soli TaxID=2712865 RepID=UPI0013EC3149|nr:hypothetical protein [Paludisphaera soli]
MPSSDRQPMSRGPMRSWLKATVQSEFLAELRPSPASEGEEPEVFARSLLSRLQGGDGGLGPDDRLAIAFREFRRWVEAERRTRRLARLGEKPGRKRLYEPWPAPLPATQPHAAKKDAGLGKPSAGEGRGGVGGWLSRIRAALAARRGARAADLSHPMWDEWLDA